MTLCSVSETKNPCLDYYEKMHQWFLTCALCQELFVLWSMETLCWSNLIEWGWGGLQIWPCGPRGSYTISRKYFLKSLNYWKKSTNHFFNNFGNIRNIAPLLSFFVRHGHLIQIYSHHLSLLRWLSGSLVYWFSYYELNTCIS